MNPLIATSDNGLVLTEHGLHIKRQLNFEEWRGILQQARIAKQSYLCVLADLTSYGRRTFGDDSVNEALEQLEFEMSDATKAETISLVPMDRRAKYGLTSEHAYVLGSLLREPADREKWAALCQEHDLSAFELKRSIEKGEVLHESDISERSGHGEGIHSIQAVAFQWQKWQRRFPDRKAILGIPEAERRKILQHISPIVEMAAELEQSLQHLN